MGACQKITKDSDAGSSEAKDEDEDASTDGSQQETVTGLDDPCSTQSECKGKDADYCMIDPNTGFGTCTIKDCTADPDNCPKTHQCCTDTKELNYPPICLSASQYELATQFDYCTD
jgi:hypothetical protein